MIVMNHLRGGPSVIQKLRSGSVSLLESKNDRNWYQLGCPGQGCSKGGEVRFTYTCTSMLLNKRGIEMYTSLLFINIDSYLYAANVDSLM